MLQHHQASPKSISSAQHEQYVMEKIQAVEEFLNFLNQAKQLGWEEKKK
ncbi:MAG: hypothetical protein NZO16_05605 [Deltaproteobacteria bacterium]|nr:hypothetical protein [Deltaproteobacteria bacterium]